MARQHTSLAPLPQNFSLDCSTTVLTDSDIVRPTEEGRIVCTCLSYTLCFLSSCSWLCEIFFFYNRELCTSCYYRFISDQLVLPRRLSLKPTQAFLFFQLIELSDFLCIWAVSLSARDSRNSLWRKWVPSDPSLCTTWFVTIYYALNVSEDDCWFSLEI